MNHLCFFAGNSQTHQVADWSEDNKKLQQQIDELLKQKKKKQSSLTINKFKGRNPIEILS